MTISFKQIKGNTLKKRTLILKIVVVYWFLKVFTKLSKF